MESGSPLCRHTACLGAIRVKLGAAPTGEGRNRRQNLDTLLLLKNPRLCWGAQSVAGSLWTSCQELFLLGVRLWTPHDPGVRA